MDCREVQELLNAFHDGELSDAECARVEEHLRGCRECGAYLSDLARADRAAGVPDPGPAYWDRFNARVMDRVTREAAGPKVAPLRPKGGWVRQQLRYLVPAAAAAVLAMVVVRYGGMQPGGPVPSGQRPIGAEPETRVTNKGEIATIDRLPSQAIMEGKPTGPAGTPRVPSPGRAVRDGKMPMRQVPEPRPTIPADERFISTPRGEQEGLTDRSRPAKREEAPPVRPAEPAVVGAPSPPAAERHVAGKAESASGMRMAKESSADGQGRPGAGAGRDATGVVAPASPCERARALAERERFREAETAQRECLARDRSAPAQEKGLVFLAELLDRQARFAEADAVLTDVDRQFPQSRPLDLYRQQRPMVQKQPAAAPGAR